MKDNQVIKKTIPCEFSNRFDVFLRLRGDLFRGFRRPDFTCLWVLHGSATKDGKSGDDHQGAFHGSLQGEGELPGRDYAQFWRLSNQGTGGIQEYPSGEQEGAKGKLLMLAEYLRQDKEKKMRVARQKRVPLYSPCFTGNGFKKGNTPIDPLVCGG